MKDIRYELEETVYWASRELIKMRGREAAIAWLKRNYPNADAPDHVWAELTEDDLAAEITRTVTEYDPEGNPADWEERIANIGREA